MEPTEADGLLLGVILDDEGRQDPYPAYRRMRTELPRWRNGFGANVLTTYQDCVEALRNPRLGRPEADMDLNPTLTGTERRRTADGDEVAMLFLNPPDHTRIRGLVTVSYTHLTLPTIYSV